MKNRPSDSPASQRMSLRLLPFLLCLLLTACRAVFSAADAAGTGSAESSTAESTASEKAQIALTDKTDLPDKTDLSPEDPAGLAAAISEEYGVRVLLGDDVPLVYKDYTVSCLDDPQKEAAALRELDSTLSLYPPGFSPLSKKATAIQSPSVLHRNYMQSMMKIISKAPTPLQPFRTRTCGWS